MSNDAVTSWRKGRRGLRGKFAWATTAVVVLTVTAAAGSFTCVHNSDIFWHLASGEWMLHNGRLLDFDPFSINPAEQWVNVHWLFQVVVAWLHGLGGFALLSVLKSALAAVTMLIFAISLRRHVPAAWLMLCGLLAFIVMLGRIRVRPEAFTLALLMATIALTESVRRGGSARKLWWLVPMMLVWVNMHGVYVVGLGVIWAAVIGAKLDRKLNRKPSVAGQVQRSGNLLTYRALAPVLAATVVCLVSPWPIEAAAQPFKLWTRISGQTIFYSYGVQELQPTWEALNHYPEAIALVVMTVAAIIANARAVPLCHLIWLAAFALLGLLARRNVGMLGPVCGYLLAWHGAGILRRLGEHRHRLTKLAAPMAAVASLLAAAMIAGFATEWLYRARNSVHRFGPGLQEQVYPSSVAQFLRDLPAEGNVLCDNFGDGGVFIYHFSHGLARPRRLVYMDGRLEAHSLKQFIEQHQIHTAFRTAASAGKVKLPDTVRFIIVRHDALQTLTALSQSPRFNPVYIGRAGVCFARIDWIGPTGELPQSNIDDFDRPLDGAGMITGMKPARRHWYRNNPRSPYYQVGSILLSMGRLDAGKRDGRIDPMRRRFVLLAIRYLSAARTEGIVPGQIAIGALAQAYQQWAMYCPAATATALPVDISSARALYLYEQLDLTDLDDSNMQMFALQRIVAMVADRQIDAADKVVSDFLDRLPASQRVNPPRNYLELQDTIAGRLDTSRLYLSAAKPEDLTPLKRAKLLSGPQLGMIDAAIDELRATHPRSGAADLMLGDLLLRRGQVAAARQVYAGTGMGESQHWQLDLREALCLWAEGNVSPAAEKLARLAKACGRPLVAYYRASLLEQLGLYSEARSALAAARSDDERLQKLIEEIRVRLQVP